MAYPFPRFGPQTPPRVKSMNSPRGSMSNGITRSTRSYIYYVIIAGAILLLLIKSYAGKGTRQLDRVPFSRDRTEE